MPRIPLQSSARITQPVAHAAGQGRQRAVRRADFPAGLNATWPSSVEAMRAPVLGEPVVRGK